MNVGLGELIALEGWNIVAFQSMEGGESLVGVIKSGTLQYENSSPLTPYMQTNDFSIGGNFQGATVNGSFSGIINKFWYSQRLVYTQTLFLTLYNFPSNI